MSLTIAVLIISILLILYAQGSEVSKTNKQIYSDLKNKSYVSVIIKTKENLSLSKIKDFQLDNRPVRKYKNLISMQVSKKELEDLEKNSLIEKIEPSPKIKAFLQDSAKVVNATNTWQLKVNGINITGIDKSVCVIDTGINFTHPDLAGKNKTCVIDCFNKDCTENCSIGDDNGHGTHVAGIIAASPGITGIAPGSKLIGLKVLDENGNSDAVSGVLDLTYAIDWCVTNKAKYNISVISMSLGTISLYSDYCDSSFSSNLAPSINSAILSNISVIAATGNQGPGVPRNTTHIAAPACIKNVTAVSATDKDDSISSYGHYNSLVELVAPGTNINSTYNTGYAAESGTSMSTPHVAAAFALISQYYKLMNGREYTSLEIKTVLKNTGKNITASGLNFNRIDIYTAVLSLAGKPNVTLVSPADSLSTRQNQTFICNATSNFELKNATFYLWNSSLLINTTIKSISGLSNSTNFSYNFTYEDDYLWNRLFADNISLRGFAISNFSIRYDLTSPSISIILPLNNSWYNTGRFNVSLNENGNCWYSLDSGENTSMNRNGKNFSANYILTTGIHNITYYCNDTSGNFNSSNKIYFNVELINPNVTLVSPADSYSLTGTSAINFEYNASDNINISKCDLLLNGEIKASNSSEITNNTNTITYSVSPGSYNWQINCTDEAGNSGNSSLRSLVINSPPSQNTLTSSGGGSGTPMPNTYIATYEQSFAGYTKELKSNDKIKFEIFDERGKQHTLTIEDVADNYANLTIASNPIKLILGIGQSIKLNLTSSEYYNLYIKVDEILNKKVKLTIQSINEKIATSKDNLDKKEDIKIIAANNQTPKDNSKDNTSKLILLALIITIFIHLIMSHLTKKSKKEIIKEIKKSHDKQ